MGPLLNVTGPSDSRLLVLQGVQSPVRGVEKGTDGIGIAGITSNAYTDGKYRLLDVSSE
jgi:hypothetical protein